MNIDALRPQAESPSDSILLTKAEVAEADRLAPAHREMLRGLLSAFTIRPTGTFDKRGISNQSDNSPHHNS